MEGTHGQLGTRLTNRLSRDYTNGLTDVDTVSASEVTSVALRTNAIANFTGNRRAHHQVIDLHIIEFLYRCFVEHGARVECNFVGARNQNWLRQHTSQHSIAQGLNNIATFNDRRHRYAIARLTVDLGNDQVLGNVNKTTRQVTGVGRLQCGISQSLSGTVSRDKVLQYVKALTEVSCNRRLNNRAIRLGHQATHTSKLANLSGGTTSA